MPYYFDKQQFTAAGGDSWRDNVRRPVLSDRSLLPGNADNLRSGFFRIDPDRRIAVVDSQPYCTSAIPVGFGQQSVAAPSTTDRRKRPTEDDCMLAETNAGDDGSIRPTGIQTDKTDGSAGRISTKTGQSVSDNDVSTTKTADEPTTGIGCLIIRMQPPFIKSSEAWRRLTDNGPSFFAGEALRLHVLQLMQPHLKHPLNRLLTSESTADGGCLTNGTDDFRFGDVVVGSETDLALRSVLDRPVSADRWIDLADAFRIAVVVLGDEADGFRLYLPF